MRDAERNVLERSRPQGPALKAINHCLDCLFSDRERGLSDMVVAKLTYNELIGALLMARDLADNEGRYPGYGGSYD